MDEWKLLIFPLFTDIYKYFMHFFQDGLVQGQPLWALVFYCMRCGDLEAALSALSESQ